jgi:hypothetical protein
VFTGLPSVQGYGSLVAARYAGATGTRWLGDLDGCALARGVFWPLRLAVLVVSPAGLTTSSATYDEPRTCGPVAARPGATRFFGAVRPVARVTFTGPAGGPLSVRAPRVLLLDASGHPFASPVALHVGAALTATFRTVPRAAGVELRATAPFRLGWTTLTTPAGPPEHLDTGLQVALAQRGWRLDRVLGGLTLFRAVRVAPTAWLVGATRGDRVAVTATGDDGSATLVVHAAHPVRLVRSESWLPGWSATRSSARTSRDVAVGHDGLVQAVALPAGTWTVTFTYHAPHLRVGVLVTAAALAALALALAALAVRRTRGARRPVR